MHVLGCDRIFWRGGHTALGWGSPLGKLHKDGLRVLETVGFEEVERGSPRLPAFFWCTRRAADFPAMGDRLPLIRPLPQSCTSALDDKLRCARLLNAAGFVKDRLAPETFVSLSAMCHELRQRARSTEAEDGRLYFLKHRLGVKGQAVTPLRERALLDWLEVQPRREGDFVVQREVPPALSRDGHKFVMRCHVLVACRVSAPPAAWLHGDVIVLTQAVPYSHDADNKAAHISQCGRHHPPPKLLSELGNEHPGASPGLPPRLQYLVSRTIAAAAPDLIPEERCPRATLYSLMGFDVALDAHGSPQLLEVNAYPAIADGTMSKVPSSVYTRLVRDVVSLLVLPALEGVAPVAGGFISLPDAFKTHVATVVGCAWSGGRQCTGTGDGTGQ